MITIDYNRENHRQIINACALALRAGKIVAYPTDTLYGLACDVTNKKAVERFYTIKQRQAKKPVSVIVPSVSFAKSIAEWNSMAQKLAESFWPGALTIILPVAFRHSLELVNRSIERFSAGTKTIGLRMPDNLIALDLAQTLREPIPATGANAAGGGDCYSAQ